MRIIKVLRVIFAIGSSLLIALHSSTAHATAPCQYPVLLHQHRDIATIEALELEWSRAFLRGDTAFEECLLAPDFTQIMRNGDVKNLADELAKAAKNKDHPLTFTKPIKATVHLHGNVAVAYGRASAGIAIYADYYVWENGRWRAYFGQLTGTAPRT